MSYTLPQVKVAQVFSQVPSATVANLNAFVFGPNFQLFRYSETAEKALIGLGAYIDASTTYAWPGIAAGMIADTSYAALYAESIWAEYLTLDDAYGANVLSETYRNKIRIPTMILATGNTYTRSDTLRRNVIVGDRVVYSYTDSYGTHTGSSKVTALEADVDVAVVATPTNKASNVSDQVESLGAAVAATANTNVFTGALGYIGAGAAFPPDLTGGVLDDIITVTVTTSGAAGTAYATVAWTNTGYSRTGVAIEDVSYTDGQIYVGYGLYAEFTAAVLATFTAGDVFTFTLDGAYTQVDGGAAVGVGSDEASAGEIASYGTFLGTSDTVYKLEVIRGGVYTRAITVNDSIVQASGFTLDVGVNATLSTDWTKWYGGERDAEYILTCTTAGAPAAALFALTSDIGDTETSITLSETVDAGLGDYGLVGQLSGAGTTFAVGDQFVIRVNASRPRVKVTDTNNIDSTTYATVAANTGIALGALGGYGVFGENVNTVDIAGGDGGLLLGEIYYVTVTAAANAEIRTLVLADDVDPDIGATLTLASLRLFLVQASSVITSKRVQTPGDYNWTAAAAGVTVTADLAVQDSSWVAADLTLPWLPVYSATLYMEYRALRTDTSSTINAITDITDVATELGTVHPDNPLAQGVYNALLNSGDRTVYYMGIPTNNIAGWTAVLDRASISDVVYAFAPVTQLEAVFTLVEAHINALSTAEGKKWRIAFISAATPVIDPIYTIASHPSGIAYKAVIAYDATDAAYTKLTFVDADDVAVVDITAVLDDVTVGDKVRISFEQDQWGDDTYTEYTVASLVSNNSLKLTSGPASAIETGEKCEVHHPYTTAEQADAIAAVSTGYYNHRIYNVFPSQFTNDGVLQTGEFGACIVAGLASSVPPHHPITNVEVEGADDLPLVYQTYNRTQLNTMAEYGTLILMQELAGSTVYVRHQVSTKASAGNINTTELSVVKNFDSISYFFAARFAPYIGRYNVSTGLIELLEGILEEGLDFLGTLTDLDGFGPQLNLDETEIVTLMQHPILEDHVLCTVNVGLPKPFNVLELTLVA